jgi:hypothetical protein
MSKTSNQSKARHMHALHVDAAERSSVIFLLMLRIQQNFGQSVLEGITNTVHAALEAEDALP